MRPPVIRGDYMITKTNKCLAGFALVLFFIGAGLELAQAASRKKGADGLWNGSWKAQTKVESEDNTFNLSPGVIFDKNLNDPRDAASGRYKDMDSVSDIILSPTLSFDAGGKTGLLPGKLVLGLDLGYNYYTQNPLKGYADFGLSIEQETSKQGSVRLQTRFIPAKFKKALLADGVDSNLNGKISRGERVYKAGNFSELDLELDYSHKLLKRKDAGLGLTGMVLAGYNTKRYNMPFKGRNEVGMRAGLEFGLDLLKNWTADIGYTLASSKSPITAEVQILDEPDFKTDFNGDADILDLNVRSVQRVNRSNTERRLGMSTTVGITGSLDLTAGYGYLDRDFSSNEAFNSANKGRKDRKNTYQAGFALQLSKAARLKLNYKYEGQRTNRAGDPGSIGEVTDYINRTIGGSVTYKF